MLYVSTVYIFTFRDMRYDGQFFLSTGTNGIAQINPSKLSWLIQGLLEPLAIDVDNPSVF